MSIDDSSVVDTSIVIKTYSKFRFSAMELSSGLTFSTNPVEEETSDSDSSSDGNTGSSSSDSSDGTIESGSSDGNEESTSADSSSGSASSDGTSGTND